MEKLGMDSLEKLSGGAALENEIPTKVGGPGGVWKPKCPSCGKEMPGGHGVIRIHMEGAEHPYFCTECAEKFLNAGKAVIASGYESHYEQYQKSLDDNGNPIYGWRKTI